MTDKVIIVTGAGGALGGAAARLAIAHGMRVAGIARSGAPVASEGLGFSGVNLSDPAACAGAIAAIAAATERIDALLNIAGGFAWATTAQSDPDLWAQMHATNLLTALNASKAAMAHLVACKGAIVNVGAASALQAGAGMGPYAASKAGVHALTRAMAAELEGQVRVNAVLPSIIDMPGNRQAMPDADTSRWVRPEDIARVMLFLASDDARAVTGALIPVTGRA